MLNWLCYVRQFLTGWDQYITLSPNGDLSQISQLLLYQGFTS